jgi:hypothetical protein
MVYSPDERVAIVQSLLKLTSLEYIDGKLKKRMGITEACEKIGVAYDTVAKWRKENPSIDEMFTAHKASRSSQMRYQAKTNVEKALYGHMKLKDKEVVDISLRFLEKTDDEFKDRKEISIKDIDLSVPMEELEERAKLLIASLGETK